MATLVRVTERISGFINDVLHQEEVPDGVRKELKCYSKYEKEHSRDEASSIPFELIRKAINHSNRKHIYLHEILEGSEVHFPPLKEAERNPELLARLEKLKAEQENKRYQEMTHNVNAQAYGGDNLLSGVGREVRNVQSQLMGVFNVVLTVLGAFTFGFMAGYYAGKPVAYCVILGFALGLITAAADLYFFIKNEL